MQKQKIIWLHSHTLMSTGGTRFIHEVIDQLSKKYQIELIVEKTSLEWKKTFTKSGAKVTSISNFSSNSILYWLFFPYFLINNYLQLRNKISKDSIVISSMFPFNFLGSLLSSKHIFYCFEPFAFFYDDDLMKEQGFIKYQLMLILKTLYSWIDKRGVLDAEKLLAINPSVGKHISSIYGKSPDAYSYLGVDTDHFNSTAKVKKEAVVTFFHSTDYTPLKGTNYLLEVLPLLVKYKDQFQIVISETIANAKLKQKIIATAKKLSMETNLVFKGHLPYSQLPTEYSKAHAYLFLGNPNAVGATAASLSVLEAQSCGLPVLRSIGNDDEIIDGKTGIAIDPRQPKQLAAAMRDVINNPQKYAKMKTACIAHIESRYRWSKVADVFINSIESLQ